ncbi:MAG: sulfatase-like hydrolase/transferase [Phyllobacterium sp.]|uniref:sulfatase-like hydrolase/transferase n=1 Tax=Phyllobacterium sp. TaxID=1871046 RepID=UPI0030F3009F
MKRIVSAISRTALGLAAGLVFSGIFLPARPALAAEDGAVLPFPPAPSAGVAGPTLKDSTHKRRLEQTHLPADAPNILIVLMDDVGFGVADTFGGVVHTPTLTKLAEQGISYNSFHTTAICSPTRAALLTGRNHHRVGSGTIAERAVNWDGYVGVIPKTAATVAEVLKDYGYNTAAFGKWHNTPATETTAMGPFDRWPTGYGFEYFYGFVAGETSQWEPRLVENTTLVEPPHDPKYHLTTDLADHAISWLHKHRAFSPDRPFLMYWAPGASHGPHHIFSEWADRYKGKFNGGWDAMREQVFASQEAMGWIPADTKLAPRPDTLPGWDSIPESERSFQTRLMEVFAGFTEHADHEAGRVIDEIGKLGLRDNTLVFYIFGDNGSSAEGQAGTISELLAQNGIPNTIDQHLKALDKLGGLKELGGPDMDNMYNAGWAWAGSSPFQATKLVASYFGGTRNPLVVSWPAKIAPDRRPHSQFHHVNDIAPTIYDILGIQPPREVNGQPQDPIDGVSMAYSFKDAAASGTKVEQYFENNGSRALYKDGWIASVFGPFVPWQASKPFDKDWDPDKDTWALYDLSKDFSQANDLAAVEQDRLAAMKARFLEVAKENKVFPIGAGNWLRLHPEDRIKTPYTTWNFDEDTIRMPEFTAPGLGRESNVVTVHAELGDNANGVIYALGGASGGLSVYMDAGYLVYEYNMMIIENYQARSAEKIAPGKHLIEIDTTLGSPKPLSAADVILKVDGKEVARTTVSRTVPAAFTASETFDVGVDLGSPVSTVYSDRRPFKFDGKIDAVRVDLK